MDNIIQTLHDFGLDVDRVVPDGHIHRCKTCAKQKNNKDGWYIAKRYKDQVYCYYGCWVRGDKGKVSTLSGSSQGHEKEWEQLRAARLLALEQTQKANLARAEKYMKDCRPLLDFHPYLKKKQVGNYGLFAREDTNLLVIPLYAPGGKIISFQTIDPEGQKRFMAGEGSKTGACFPLPGNEAVVCICEGYATGATIHETTGYKVLCAMDAGNLEPVAKTAKAKWPQANLIICADNDHKTPGNPGRTKGKKVADKLGGSCVWPTGIEGSDFNDMAAELGPGAVRAEIIQQGTIEVLTKEDCIGVDDSLQIPAEAIPGGLIEAGVRALEGDILQYSLPLVLTVISRAIAGKISLNGVYPNVFNIKVGGTSTGKTASDRKFLRCLEIKDFVSVNDIASGPGLWRAIAKNPHGMGFFDEVSSLFQRATAKGGVDMITEGKSTALLDVFSRSGETFKKSFGDPKNALEIHNPCFSLIGNATPTIFDAIEARDFETGLMQRFDFWVYDGPIKQKPLLINSRYFEKTKAFIARLESIMATPQPDQSLRGLIKSCVDLSVTDGALNKIQEYSKYITEEANKADSDGMTGFISRRFDLALKYALIHHASMAELFSDITDQDIKYGILIAEMLGGWKSNVLPEKVVTGEFHKDCKIFKAAIKAALKVGRDKPTFKQLANRKPRLKNWTPKYSEAVIQVLKKRGEIITKEGRKATQYFLTKEE